MQFASNTILASNTCACPKVLHYKLRRPKLHCSVQSFETCSTKHLNHRMFAITFECECECFAFAFECECECLTFAFECECECFAFAFECECECAFERRVRIRMRIRMCIRMRIRMQTFECAFAFVATLVHAMARPVAIGKFYRELAK